MNLPIAAWLCGAIALSAVALPARAQLAVSPDVALILSGAPVADREVAHDDLAGGIALESFGGLPAGVDVDAYQLDSDGAVLFSVDRAVALPGGITATPDDVIRLDGGIYQLAFDGAAHGVPRGANLDALTRAADGDLIVSFDIAVVLPGGVSAGDEDLVGFDGASWSLALDLSSVGVTPAFDPALDVDAVDALPGGFFALSFDTSGSAGGVGFHDEDLVWLAPGSPGIALLFDATVHHAAWSAADLDAVMLPEPDAGSIAAALALLAALRRARRHVRRRPVERSAHPSG